MKVTVTKQTMTSKFDWATAPMPEAEQRLAELKAEFLRCAAILDERRSRPLPRYQCWSQSMLDQKLPDGADVISAATRAACRREGEPGREAFRDDGAEDQWGNRVTIRCCGHLCFQDYQRWKGSLRLRAKEQREQARGVGGPRP